MRKLLKKVFKRNKKDRINFYHINKRNTNYGIGGRVDQKKILTKNLTTDSQQIEQDFFHHRVTETEEITRRKMPKFMYFSFSVVLFYSVSPRLRTIFMPHQKTQSIHRQSLICPCRIWQSSS